MTTRTVVPLVVIAVLAAAGCRAPSQVQPAGSSSARAAKVTARAATGAYNLATNSRVETALGFTESSDGAAITYATEGQVLNAIETANAAVFQAANAEAKAVDALAKAAALEANAREALTKAQSAGSAADAATAAANLATVQANAAAAAAAAAETKASTAAAQTTLVDAKAQDALNKALAAANSVSSASNLATVADAKATAATTSAAAAEARAAAAATAAAAADAKAAAAEAKAQQALDAASAAGTAATKAQQALDLANSANVVASAAATKADDALASLTTLSVRRYGAKGDGITDDTIALQAALTDAVARGGATLTFPEGQYRVTGTLNVAGPVTIAGVGRDASVIKASALANLFFVQASNVRFRDLGMVGPITDRTVVQTADTISAIAWANATTGLEVTGCAISDFWNGIYLRGSEVAITNVRFERIGPSTDGVWQPGPACINNWANGIGDQNITIEGCIAKSCSGFTVLNGSKNVAIEACTIDNASYIGIGSQRVTDLRISDNTISNTYDNAIDCQQCSNTAIRGNTIVNAGRSTNPASGDRRAIFWGTDGVAGTEPSGLTLTGNNVRNTGSAFTGGLNLASKGGKNITVSGNNFEHVRSVVQKSASMTFTGNTFVNSQLQVFDGLLFTSNTLLNSHLSCDSIKDSLIEGNRFTGFWTDETGATKDHALHLTGVSSGLTRASIHNNQIVTGQRRANGYFFIEAGTNLQSWSVVGNRTDARFLIKDAINRVPSTFADNVSEVLSADPNLTSNAEMTNVIYVGDTAMGAAPVALNLLGNAFIRKTRRVAAVLYGGTTAAMGVWEVGSFDAGNGQRSYFANRTSYSAGTNVDITAALSGSTLNFTAAGTAGPNGKLILYLP